MDSFLSALLAVAAFAGHVIVWTWFYNRLHASRVPSRRVAQLEKFMVLAMLGSALLPASWILAHQVHWLVSGDATSLGWIRLWCGVCCAALLYASVAWALRIATNHDGGRLLATDTEILDVAAHLGYPPGGDPRTRWQGRLPGNQIWEIHLQRKTIAISDLPGALEGLRIAQVSDLHMTGQLTRAFFDIAIDRVNAWEADLVAITGDLVDRADCVEWIRPTLGRLTSRSGVYAILGNHDQRLDDVARLRRALAECGITDLGGRCVRRTVRGTAVLLAGNESPWFPAAPMAEGPPDAERPFSILLSHSPDTISWARRRCFQLMLAGHTHGGQIRFPLIGPVVCPSRFGVRYASGLFDVPPTVMHVSRGLSGVHTLRFRCPPELTLLELRRPPQP